MLRIRDARPDEAEALSALVMRSKAYWGYDEKFLAACRDELGINAEELTARRVVVAVDAGTVAGVASLEGSPPEGKLGLLFVEPRLIRTGVGRQLYMHVLRTARESGFRRLAIDADPHALPFYRAMGAMPPLEVALLPRPRWLRAWTGDAGRAVHIGNAGEFQRQFGPVPGEAAAHYSCMAVLATPHPAALVLPNRVPRGWLGLLARQLAWGEVELYDGLDGHVHRTLGRHLRGLGLPVVAWGHTEAVGELSGRRLPEGALRYESKRASNGLFRELAPAHPGIVVPEQWRPDGRLRAARLIRARARRGAATVVKSEHGAGGHGTRIVTSARRLPRGPLLLEEHIAGGFPRDVTYDGLVDECGQVHDVGTAAMDVEDTVYQGATVGPGVVPGQLDSYAVEFGHAVGRELARTGYRGWYDVDFVAAPDGRLAPTETNLRMSGPSVAFMVQARLDEIRGDGHLVRSLDHVPLGARLPERELIAFLRELTQRCAAVDTVLLTSIPTAAFAPAPYVGLVLAARTTGLLDTAEALVREAGARLGRMFR
ncbi:GNAT family N-acetyltransferase [Streptomyces sp. NPDC057445]|uniref:GNAT family N-acetyltransferase n=1 Tax=Streptomyces sp. NPDC057445 TaxID=3346136 RepID=UPI0036B7F59A